MSLWNNDEIQFARLLCELQAAGAFTPEVMACLRASMDLTDDEIGEIQERADACFEGSKARLAKPRAFEPDKTACCGAYSTYDEHGVLYCKACYREVTL